MAARGIGGSTTVLEAMARFPDGRAAALMARLGWPCALCAARAREPLSLAAKRHGNAPRAVVECFRALEAGGPDDAAVEAARRPPESRPAPAEAWRALAARYGG